MICKIGCPNLSVFSTLGSIACSSFQMSMDAFIQRKNTLLTTF